MSWIACEVLFELVSFEEILCKGKIFKIKRGGRSIVACRKFQGFRPGNTIVHLNRIEIQAGTLNRIIFEWISCFFQEK